MTVSSWRQNWLCKIHDETCVDHISDIRRHFLASSSLTPSPSGEARACATRGGPKVYSSSPSQLKKKILTISKEVVKSIAHPKEWKINVLPRADLPFNPQPFFTAPPYFPPTTQSCASCVADFCSREKSVIYDVILFHFIYLCSGRTRYFMMPYCFILLISAVGELRNLWCYIFSPY